MHRFSTLLQLLAAWWLAMSSVCTAMVVVSPWGRQQRIPMMKTTAASTCLMLQSKADDTEPSNTANMIQLPLQNIRISAVKGHRNQYSFIGVSRSSSCLLRRSLFSTCLQKTLSAVGMVGVLFDKHPALAEDADDFASIFARALKISKEVDLEGGGIDSLQQLQKSTTPSTAASLSGKTSYDFALPMSGQAISIRQLVSASSSDGSTLPKAILVVNIKQDDPIARKNIPELISLAAKYGRTGEFVVVASPTDQGYFEPDTSQLIRLKLASEYGYGINPATVITDKVNFLGTGAHPFWRWLESTCRTPAGLGRIEANFEKFLVDGGTGLPVRRYPRKFQPYDMQGDIEALLEQRPLPPPTANWREEWRGAAAEAERDTYRFQKGINVFDQ